jgi:putative integral membrane protein (TIGR02587 family)
VLFMQERTNADYARELARAAAGSVLFAFPLLMTMEMWWLGFHIAPLRLVLFLVVGLLLILGLSWYSGFEDDDEPMNDLLDALSAYAVAVLVSLALLLLFGIVEPHMPLSEIVGKVAVQSIPAAIGAIVARKQFNAGEEDDQRKPKAHQQTYAAELLLMFGGAVFVAFNVAPTDEIELISHIMTPWHALGLAALSIALQYALVYGVEFAGQETWPEGRHVGQVVLRYSVVGYAIALAVSLYVLWTFGRTDGAGLTVVATMTVVLGFPAALGAATARLVI